MIKSLPKLELEGGDENSHWVFSLPIGDFTYEHSDGEYVDMTISKEKIDEIVNHSNRAIANFLSEAPLGSTPYRIPILKEHIKNGERYGDVLQLAYKEADGKNGLWALVKWNPDTYAKISNNDISFVSIGTVSNYVDSNGNHYPVLLNEISLTATPRLKNLGSLQDTLNLRLSESQPQEKIMTPEEMATLIADALDAKLEPIYAAHENLLNLNASLLSALEAMAKPVEEPVEEPVEDAVEMSEDEEELEPELSEEDELLKLTERVSQINASLAKKGAKAKLNLSEKATQASKPTTPSQSHEARFNKLKAQGATPMQLMEDYLKSR